MKSRCCSILLCAVFALGGCLTAQENSTLAIKRQIRVGNEMATDFVLPVVADAEGNLYARYGDRWGGSEAISKVSGSGTKEASFSLSGVASLSDASIGGFCLSGHSLVALGRKSVDAAEVEYLVVFDLNGRPLSSTKIAADISAGQIAALSPEKFIVVGRARRSGSVDSIPETVIVDGAGQVITEVHLGRDVSPVDRQQRLTIKSGFRRDIDYENALVSSLVTIGEDGNAYVMRYGRSGLVFVVSADGNVIRRLSLAVPPRSSLKEIKVAKHRIAAVFLQWKVPESEVAATIVRTYDSVSGELLSDAFLDPTAPSMLAAYDGAEDFTFIGPMSVDGKDGSEPGRLHIFEVGPR
jgi:hypothetical protein